MPPWKSKSSFSISVRSTRNSSRGGRGTIGSWSLCAPTDPIKGWIAGFLGLSVIILQTFFMTERWLAPTLNYDPDA